MGGRGFSPLVATCLLVLGGAGCAGAPAAANPVTAAGAAAVPAVVAKAPAETLDPAPAPGQIVGGSVGGPVITPALRHLILDDKVGCVVLFHSNVRDAAGLKR